MDGLLNILVLEDDEDDFFLLREHFDAISAQRNLQFSLAWARTLCDAHDCRNRFEPDLIIVDYLLPDGTGESFIEELQQARSSKPVFLLSGASVDQLSPETLRQLASGQLSYMPKADLNPHTLFSQIEELLFHHLSVLIVDDDEDDLQIETMYAHDSYFRNLHVHQARTLDEARDAIDHEHFDVFVLDYLLGAERGTELIPYIQQCEQSARIILCTGRRDLVHQDPGTVRSIGRNEIQYLPKEHLTEENFQRALIG